MILTKVFAQIENPVIPQNIGSGGLANSGLAIGKLLSTLAEGFLVLSFFMGFIYLMVGAIGWITSGGEKGKLEESRNRIIHALIGIIIVASTWAVMKLIGTFVNLDWESLPIPSLGTAPGI